MFDTIFINSLNFVLIRGKSQLSVINFIEKSPSTIFMKAWRKPSSRNRRQPQRNEPLMDYGMIFVK